MRIDQCRAGKVTVRGGKKLYFLRCSSCGELWNVSSKTEYTGRYICPECEEKMKTVAEKKKDISLDTMVDIVSESEAHAERCKARAEAYARECQRRDQQRRDQQRRDQQRRDQQRIHAEAEKLAESKLNRAAAISAIAMEICTAAAMAALAIAVVVLVI